MVVTGDGTAVQTDPHALERALYGLARCAIRHGGIERLDIAVDGATLTLSPIEESAAPVLTTEELRDLGAAVANRVLPALGGSMTLDGGTLTVRLEAAAAAQ